MTDTRAKLRDIEVWLNERLIRREDVVEGLLLSSLTRSNMLQIGPPGTAKSYASRAFAACLQGNLFTCQLHQMFAREDLDGPLDMKAWESTGEWIRRIEGYMPTADLLHIDEVDKAGPAVFGLLLTALNERLYKHGDTEIPLPYLFAVGTMNAELDDPTGAMFDRWLLRTKVDYVADGADFARLLATGETDWSSPPTTTIDAIRAVHPEVASVAVGEEVVDSVQQLRSGLRANGITPSDRRWAQSIDLVKASAWLGDRTEATVADLAPLRHTLWIAPEQANSVADMVLEIASPDAKEILEIQAMVDTITAKLADAKDDSRTSLVSFAITGRVELNRAYVRLVDLHAAGGSRQRADAKRLLDRIPEVAIELMLTSGVVRDKDAARQDVRAAMPQVA